MSISSRPKLSDFQPSLGKPFQVQSAAGKVCGAWILDEIEEHESPPLETLEEADCFTLIFETPETCPQDVYVIQREGLKAWEMMATPIVSTNGKLYSQVVIF